MSPSAPRPLRRLHEAVLVMDPEPSRVWLSCGLVVLGFWLGSGWGMTTALPFNFPQQAVGVVLAATGAINLIAYAWGCARCCQLTGIIATGLWGFLAAGGFATNVHSAAGLTYLGIALLSGWTWVRIHMGGVRTRSRAKAAGYGRS